MTLEAFYHARQLALFRREEKEGEGEGHVQSRAQSGKRQAGSRRLRFAGIVTCDHVTFNN